LEFKASLKQPLTQHVYFPSTQTHILIGQLGIKRNNPDYFTVTVGNYILGGGLLTSRLFNEVRQKRGLVYAVHSQFNTWKEKGPFIIELQTRNSEANNAIKIVNETLTTFVKEGPSQQELLSAKKNLTQGFILRLASNAAIIGQLINIGFYRLPLDYLDTYKDNISSVTDQQIKRVFQDMIHPDSLLTVTVGSTLFQ
jgi:zinc protease